LELGALSDGLFNLHVVLTSATSALASLLLLLNTTPVRGSSLRVLVARGICAIATAVAASLLSGRDLCVHMRLRPAFLTWLAATNLPFLMIARTHR